jgi:replicative DNA helicase
MTSETTFILPEAEDYILGTIIANPDSAMPWACSTLLPDDFGLTVNGDLWRVLLGMEAAKRPINFASIVTELRETQKESMIPAARIAALWSSGGAPVTLPAMLDRLREKRALRMLSQGLTEIIAEINGASPDSGALIEKAQGCIDFAGKTRARAVSAPKMPDLVRTVVATFQARQQKLPDETGVRTGLTVLDRETGGMKPGATWVIAGPSKGGKSILAINLLEAAAVTEGRRCMFFGLEMPSEQNVERMFASTGGILAASLRDGALTEHDMTKIMATAGKLATAPIQFRDDVFDISEMLAAIKQYKLAYPDLFAFFVDYAQLISGEVERGANREQEVAKISTALRRITMQEKLCCVVLSQLNDDGKLRESRRIGMDATVIAIIEDEEDEPKVKRLKLIQRGGRKCTVRLAYRGDFMRFDSLPDSESYPTNEDPEQKTQNKPWKQK